LRRVDADARRLGRELEFLAVKIVTGRDHILDLDLPGVEQARRKLKRLFGLE
jgi:hypothetical protein